MEPELVLLEKLFPFQIVEVRKDGKITHSVDGIATSEAVDKDGEIADFAGTLKQINVWSEEFVRKTKDNGQEPSMGNIRVQHDSKQIGGKCTGIDPLSAEKKVFIKTQPRDSVFDELIYPGYVTGFSIAGSYLERTCNECKTDKPGRVKYCTACKKDTVSRYTPSISEISYVDNACNPDAEFTTVKADGSIVLRKFSEARKEYEEKHPPATGVLKAAKDAAEAVGDRIRKELIDAGIIKEAKTKTVAGKKLHASDFAYVGDASDTSTWKLPIHDAAHCRNALARFNQTQGIPAGEKAKIKAKIVARCKTLGIKVSEDSKKCVDGAFVKILKEAGHDGAAILAKAYEIFEKVEGETVLFKGLYTVSSLAEVLQNLQWIVASTEYERDYEGDESQVPDDLRSVLEDLIPVFVAMAEEEAKELLTQNKKSAATSGQGGSMSETNADLLKAAKDAAIALWKKAKGHFHKIAKCHEGLMKAHEKRAGHHDDMAEHYGNVAEDTAGSSKTAVAELQKLSDDAEFKKLAKVDQIEKRMDALLAVKDCSKATKHFAKMAKSCANLSKCAMKAAGHHDDLHKAAVAVGDDEEALSMGDTENDESRAHPGGSSEKTATEQIAELKKQVEDLTKKGATGTETVDKGTQTVLDAVAALAKTIDAQGTTLTAVKKDVDEKLSKLQPGSVASARLATNRNANSTENEDKTDSRLARKNASSAPNVSSPIYG